MADTNICSFRMGVPIYIPTAKLCDAIRRHAWITMMGAALLFVGGRHCYADDPFSRAVKMCVDYVHRQIPGSQFNTYLEDAQRGLFQEYGTSRDEFYFHKCLNEFEDRFTEVTKKVIKEHREELNREAVKQGYKNICDDPAMKPACE